MTWLGTVSYGVYLWHEALIRLMPGGLVPNFYTSGVAIALGIGVAALSYYLLELPLLRLKKRFEFRAGSGHPGARPGRRAGARAGRIDAVDVLVPAQREELRAAGGCSPGSAHRRHSGARSATPGGGARPEPVRPSR